MVYFTQAYGHDTGYPTESNPIDIYIRKSIAINQIEKKGYQWHPYK